MVTCAAVFGLILASSLFGGLGRVDTPPSDERARALAVEAVAKATGISPSELNTRRLENLEDDLFLSQMKIAGRIRKGAYFYEVENGGYLITPDDVTYRPHSWQRWYVAVSTTDGETFGLFRFEDANEGFRLLVTKIPVEIKDAVEARIFARFYLEAVYQRRASIVYDELRLKHNVEEHFLGYYDSRESVAKKEQRFRRWWNGFKATRVAGPLEPTVKAVGNDRYVVMMRILEMTVGRPPELWEWSVEIRRDGVSRLLGKHPLFPASVK